MDAARLLALIGATLAPLVAQQYGWKQSTPQLSPQSRLNPAMAGDEARGRVVLLGGRPGAVGPFRRQLDPAVTAPKSIAPDGALLATVSPRPKRPVLAWTSGVPATVEYAGGAPGLVAGVLQVNMRVREGVTPGAAGQVVILVRNASSQAGVTMAVE